MCPKRCLIGAYEEAYKLTSFGYRVDMCSIAVVDQWYVRQLEAATAVTYSKTDVMECLQSANVFFDDQK